MYLALTVTFFRSRNHSNCAIFHTTGDVFVLSFLNAVSNARFYVRLRVDEEKLTTPIENMQPAKPSTCAKKTLSSSESQSEDKENVHDESGIFKTQVIQDDLWVEKYAPRVYADLISDEVCECDCMISFWIYWSLRLAAEIEFNIFK